MAMYPVKVIPDKLFFKIGEVCELVEVQPHVLRYWESEFPQLTPQKNRAGQRTYRRKDVEIIMRIKQLLYDEGFTIAGAKKKLAGELRGGAKLKIVTPELLTETRPPLKEVAEVVTPQPPEIPIAAVPVIEIAAAEVPVIEESAADLTRLSPPQQQALRKLKDELQALLTMLKRDDIMSGK